MKVKYLGHSAFLFTSPVGQKVLTDPYAAGRGISYGAITEAADVVTVSHDHGDHNNAKAVTGNPTVVNGQEVIKEGGRKLVRDIDFWAFPSYHDPTQGSQRGLNAVFCFTLDRVKVCHLGDLGHPLSDGQIAQISSDLAPVHILLIPVGGFYTIDALQATALIEKMKPNIVIPMHFKTPKLDFPIAPVDDFLKGKKGIKRIRGSEVEIQFNQLPALTETWVLNPAL